jgi:Fe-S-cluster-containing dehydrogenase component
MAKALIIDVSKCSGCMCCYVACKDEHFENDWSPYAKPQPLTGHFWIRVKDMERGTIPKVKVSYIPVLCMHCENPPCVSACQVKAINKRNDGIVLICPEACDGCKLCISACPYEAIFFNEEFNIAQKCTLCAHLLDRGWDMPRCVEQCPHEAIKFGEQEDLKMQIENAEVLKPEYGTKPRVYYLNMPKPFIAGSVYDPLANECVEGTSILATDSETGKTYSTKTDEFGDFWLNNLEWNHTYSIIIKKEGYFPRKIEDIKTDKDINLGDITLAPMTRCFAARA